ncbi:MAG TPA: ABC transporter ATP-binding protein [Campylobacterales bacterium]|nr:ABC transporter ATP-binding protein [Campylobacterales bacterium]
MIKRPIVLLENVSKYYMVGEYQICAIDDVSLSLYQGEMKVLVGNSGSGKSTLLHLIGCIDKPDNGSIFIDGFNTDLKTLEELSSLRLNKIGFIFQSFNLIPVLTAAENVEFPLLFRKNNKKWVAQRIDEVLEKVGLQDRRNHYPRQLSGGQQQRVAIARALIGDPSILIADEPTANLDSKTGMGILDLIESIKKENNLTVLVASHDSVVLNKIKDKIYIKDGKIVSSEVGA